MTTFKVGDQVIIKKNDYYTITTGGQEGIILKASKNRGEPEYTVSFDNKVWVKMHEQARVWTSGGSLPEDRAFYILPEYLELLSKAPTKDRVQERIKTLWNNSNWVKNNPSQAY